MITSITLRNFQSHPDNTLDLHPGVNVIGGASDSGKSAILRALNWNANNKPNHDNFISDFAGKEPCEVIVNYDDNEVKRYRRKADQAYYLNGVEYKAFGREVPEEIAEVVNMLDVNWQSQLDPPFLLSETSGQVASTLNRVSSLQVIDKSLARTTSELRKTKRDLESTEDRIAMLEHESLELHCVDAWDAQLLKIEAREEKLESVVDDAAQLEALINAYADIRIRLQGLPTLQSVSFDDVEADVESLDNIKASSEELEDLIEDCMELTHRVTQAEKAVTDAQKQYSQEMPDECPLCGSYLK